MRQKFIFSPNNAKEAISVSEAWPWQDLHSSPMRCFKKSAAHIIQVICHFSILYLRNQCTSCIILYFASFCIYIFEVIFFCIEYTCGKIIEPHKMPLKMSINTCLNVNCIAKSHRWESSWSQNWPIRDSWDVQSRRKDIRDAPCLSHKIGSEPFQSMLAPAHLVRMVSSSGPPPRPSWPGCTVNRMGASCRASPS